jgi:hypothetical protein
MRCMTALMIFFIALATACRGGNSSTDTLTIQSGPYNLGEDPSPDWGDIRLSPEADEVISDSPPGATRPVTRYVYKSPKQVSLTIDPAPGVFASVVHDGKTEYFASKTVLSFSMRKDHRVVIEFDYNHVFEPVAID